MEWGSTTLAFGGLGAAALATSLWKLKRRLELSRAKHSSLTGHARMSRRVASFLPFYEYDEAQFFRSDDAPEHDRRAAPGRLHAAVGALSRRALPRRSGRPPRWPTTFPICSSPTPTGCRSNTAASCASTCRLGSFLQSSAGVTVTDLDGNAFYDLTGSYGVNLFGNDFYKACMERGLERVRELGPVLGSYHPVIADNVRRLKEISGLDEVSFHMSGTEAVMQAVRLARYHTRRSHLVRFCGAYHGWWGDVQPGVGNPLPARETYTLKDMSEDALQRAAHAPRHRLRPGQSIAGAASQCGRAGRHVAGRQRAHARISTRRPTPTGSSGCGRSAPNATSF